jgi:hypothetical protein
MNGERFSGELRKILSLAAEPFTSVTDAEPIFNIRPGFFVRRFSGLDFIQSSL